MLGSRGGSWGCRIPRYIQKQRVVAPVRSGIVTYRVHFYNIDPFVNGVQTKIRKKVTETQ